MPNQIALDLDFDAPALRAGLDVMLILARVLRNSFSSTNTIERLEASNVTFISVVKILGSILANPSFVISNTGEIADLWEQFFLDKNIKYLPKEPRSILERIRDESIALAKTRTEFVEDLQKANVRAYKIVVAILKEHGAARLMPRSPAPIEIKNDSSGRGYSCATSPLTEKISWSYQVVSHGLMGLILADVVLSHEYLSHLVPQNPHLDHTIREQWLVAALGESLYENHSYPRWKIRLWPSYRTMLKEHFSGSSLISAADSIRRFGYDGVEEACIRLHSTDRALYWKLTLEIIEHEPDEDHARLASWVAYRLIGANPRVLSTQNPNSLNDLRAHL